LMFSRLIFGIEGVMANSDHLVGAMIITIAVCAMAEIARPLRFLNLPFGLWLLVAPWLLGSASLGVTLNDIVAGLVVI
ncbi:MAG: dTDP-glucose 4,6-dehydratase, partial [Mesorhizobium sp.]